MNTPLRDDTREKNCVRCNIVKPRAEFYEYKRNVDGLSSYCKVCVGIARNENAKTDKGRANRLQSFYRSTQKEPEKYKARYTLRNAVAGGKVVRPTECQRCGRTVRLQGHHDDYSKPLEVQWLCHHCHLFVENKLKNIPAPEVKSILKGDNDEKPM